MAEPRLPEPWRNGRLPVIPWREGLLLVLSVVFAGVAVFGSESKGMGAVGFAAGVLGITGLWGFVMTLRQAFPGSSTAGVMLDKNSDGEPVLRIRQSRARQLGAAAIALAAATTAVLLGWARLIAGSVIIGGLLLGAGILVAGMFAIAIAHRAPWTS